MRERKKPNWLFRTAVVLLLLPVLYVASFGPVTWIWSYLVDEGILSHESPLARTLSFLYAPLIWLAAEGPPPIAYPLDWYRSLVRL